MPSIDPEHLARARKSAADWRLRCSSLVGITSAERAEIQYATLLADLRFSSYYFATRRWRRALIDAITLAMYATVCGIEEALAFLTLHDYVTGWTLVLEVWAGAAVAWWLPEVVAIFKVIRQERLQQIWPNLVWFLIGLAGLAIVIVELSHVMATHPTRIGPHLAAVALGAVGGATAPRINETARNAVYWIPGVRGHRIRPHDDMLSDLVFAASWACSSLHGSGRESWRDRRKAMLVARVIENAASNTERSATFAALTPWWNFRLRAQLREPYIAVGAVIRKHKIKVLSAETAAEWQLICESLSVGALAAARHNWSALTAAAGTTAAVRRNRFIRTLVRLSTPATLAVCAVVLPHIFQLGIYGPSLRSILAVSAALALLPGSTETTGVIRDSLSKALSNQR